MMVKLDEVVVKISGNEDRFTTDLEYYLAGEHYESERIAIYKKGIIKDNLGVLGFKFHFPFKAGDTIFMSRNPHLKKAGMVTYDGICSDTSYILRTRDNNILSERFLPLVLQNDRFWRWFEENKSGSVNYLLNWKSLKEYEFDLPPIEEQLRIADIAWAVEETRVAYERMIAATDELVKSQFMEQFRELIEQPEACSKIEDICTVFADGDWIESKDQSDEGIRLIQTGNIGNAQYLDKGERARFITEDTFERLNCTEVKANDILISRLPDPVGRACIIPEGLGKCITAVDCTIVRLESRVKPEYFIAYTRSPFYMMQVASRETGSTRKRISRKNLGMLTIPVPTIASQERFAALVRQSDKSKFELEQALAELNATYKRIITENLC